MRLLVAIADRPFREEMHNFLLSAGFDEVVLANRAVAAVRAVERESYDAVLLSGSRPNVDAATVRRVLRSAPATPIVVLIEARDQAEWAGAVGDESCVQCVIRDSFTQNLLGLLRGGADDEGRSPL